MNNVVLYEYRYKVKLLHESNSSYVLKYQTKIINENNYPYQMLSICYTYTDTYMYIHFIIPKLKVLKEEIVVHII